MLCVYIGVLIYFSIPHKQNPIGTQADSKPNPNETLKSLVREGVC